MHEDERSEEQRRRCDEQTPGGLLHESNSAERILTVCCAPLDAMIKEGSIVWKGFPVHECDALTDKKAWFLYANSGGEIPANFCPFCGRALCEVQEVERPVI